MYEESEQGIIALAHLQNLWEVNASLISVIFCRQSHLKFFAGMAENKK